MVRGERRGELERELDIRKRIFSKGENYPPNFRGKGEPEGEKKVLFRKGRFTPGRERKKTKMN